MRLSISLVLLSGLLLSLTASAQAAPHKYRAAPKVADSASGDIPPQSWSVTAAGFVELFKKRNDEVESTEPNRFFPASVAFALGSIDEAGHFLMLKCYAASENCNSKRDALEERMVYATLLQVVRTKVQKDLLYNVRTWELTPLGLTYIEKLRKRYPDLSTRLGRLIRPALANKS